MRSENQIALIKDIHARMDAGQTMLSDELTRLPVDTYTCEARLKREHETLFKRHPLGLGLSHELPEPGCFVTNDRAGVPVLMTRDQAGEVRAFLNVCRHRGAKVETAMRGKVRKVLSCPYHGWSYGLDGALVHVPNAEAFEGLDRSCHGLTQLPCEERHGIIWVMLDPAAKMDAAGSLDQLDDELGNFGIENYHFYEQRVIEQPFNWKIAVDTFLEPYHFGVLHRNSIGPIFVHDLYLAHQFGPHIREVMPRKTINSLRDAPHEQWDILPHTVLVYVLFPSTIIVMQKDHFEIWRIYADPNDPARCTMTMDFLTPESVTTDKAREYWNKNLDLLMTTVLDEDFPTGATIQQGLTSGAQTHVTVGRNEPAVAMFELTAARLAGAAAA
jgi:phenylpropionate dioxygenase-like ring-hydroxylating dioxygenase large terminal subunit